MRRLIFNLFEKKFLKYLHRKHGRTVTTDSLVFAFHDLDGMGYYKFPKETGLPMTRLGKLHGYIRMLSAGIDGEELENLIAHADKALSEGIKNVKNASKIGFILSQIQSRKEIIVHDELFYNIIAVQIIRNDESPTAFNQAIHMEKVAAFRRLNEENDTFFLNIHEYLRALNWSNITRDELNTLLQNSIIHRKAENEMLLKMFASISANQKTTLESML